MFAKLSDSDGLQCRYDLLVMATRIYLEPNAVNPLKVKVVVFYLGGGTIWAECPLCQTNSLRWLSLPAQAKSVIPDDTLPHFHGNRRESVSRLWWVKTKLDMLQPLSMSPTLP